MTRRTRVVVAIFVSALIPGLGVWLWFKDSQPPQIPFDRGLWLHSTDTHSVRNARFQMKDSVRRAVKPGTDRAALVRLLGNPTQVSAEDGTQRYEVGRSWDASATWITYVVFFFDRNDVVSKSDLEVDPDGK